MESTDNASRLYTICSPWSCKTEACAEKGTILTEEHYTDCRIFTLHHGIKPALSESRYCRYCNTRYYNNYCVKSASSPDAVRTYYGFDFCYLQISESSFIDNELCVFIETQFAFSHAGAETIAKIYNISLKDHMQYDTSHTMLRFDLNSEMIWNAFFLNALLRHKARINGVLVIPHHGESIHRLDDEMARRNKYIAGTGQELWAHACKGCMKVLDYGDGSQGYITAGVTDGVSVGHLCCSVRDCTEPISDHRQRFCPLHINLSNICAIQGCANQVDSGHLTCNERTHRAIELNRKAKGKAMFQLKKQLRHAGIFAGLNSNDAHENDMNSPPNKDSHSASVSESVSEALNSRTIGKGHFSRTWTHNEQLFVRCCGIIISRATFFGSEGVSGVKDFLKSTFPPCFPGSLPSYIFYDNNCKLKAHLLATNDSYFDYVGLPVDIFHAKTKHKGTDVICQKYCNAAQFSELISAQNEWVFNSSAAEQVNNWFGKFHTIVREMSAIRYNFFLDEMIAIYNRHRINVLREKGYRPYVIPEDILRTPVALVSAL